MFEQCNGSFFVRLHARSSIAVEAAPTTEAAVSLEPVMRPVFPKVPEK
jgi:hypothetical protein